MAKNFEKSLCMYVFDKASKKLFGKIYLEIAHR